MQPIFGNTAPSGSLKVWNATQGYLDVSTEGHLLQGQTTAWVEETPEIIALIDQGLLVLVDGEILGKSSQTGETSKKKRSSTTVDQSSTATDVQPVVDKVANKNEAIKSETLKNDVSVETV